MEPFRYHHLTNKQILESRGEFLTQLQRQYQFIMRQEVQPRPCPNCGTDQNVPDAAGMPFAEFDFSNPHYGRNFRCIQCKRKLTFVLPVSGGVWHWVAEFEKRDRA